MAKRFTRRRWRRPQRLTLEGPPPVRRKHIVVPEIITLETDLVRHANRRRMAILGGGLVVAAVVAGAVVGLVVAGLWVPVASLWVIAAAAAVAIVYLLAAIRLGDGWILSALKAEPCDDAGLTTLVRRYAEAVSIPAPDVYVGAGEAPNTLSGGLRRGWLCVTAGVLGMGLLEREALVAREIVALRDGDAKLASVHLVTAGGAELATKGLSGLRSAPALFGLMLWPVCALVGLVAARIHAERDAARADIGGALLTRYPPGMVAALTALGGEQTEARLRASAGFWAAPRRGGEGRTAVAERARRVAEM